MKDQLTCHSQIMYWLTFWCKPDCIFESRLRKRINDQLYFKFKISWGKRENVNKVLVLYLKKGDLLWKSFEWTKQLKITGFHIQYSKIKKLLHFSGLVNLYLENEIYYLQHDQAYYALHFSVKFEAAFNIMLRKDSSWGCLEPRELGDVPSTHVILLKSAIRSELAGLHTFIEFCNWVKFSI